MNIVLLASAKRDLDALSVYVKDDLRNEIAARNTVTTILRKIQLLEDFPEVEPSLSKISDKLDGYRYIVADNYLIIYKLVPTEVQIVHIPYARSDYMQLLLG